MIKRLIPLFLALALLSGCNNAGGNVSPPPQDSSGPKTIAAFIYPGEPGDRLGMAHERARAALNESGGCDAQKYIIPPNDAIDQVGLLSQQGCSVIFLCDSIYDESADTLCAGYPDMRFIMFNGSAQCENLYNFSVRIYQAAYLAGIAAGCKTASGVLGYAASVGNSENVRSINAFALGARSVRPDAKVIVDWTGGRSDVQAAYDIAAGLIGQGCDVIADGQYSDGAADTAEDSGVYYTCLGSPPGNADSEFYIGTAELNFTPYYEYIVQCIKEDTPIPHDLWLSMSDGVLDFSPGAALNEEQSALINGAKTNITDNNYNVFAGPIYDVYGNLIYPEGEQIGDDDLRVMLWFMLGVEGMVPQG